MINLNKKFKILNNIKKRNKKVLGYGATAKAVTVLNYCNINSDLIKNFTDTTPEKLIITFQVKI